ncbi:MAG: M48 family metalloprotease, partial [Candidatus Eremiobacteraeota bacterium]|nr:M48 family metalloprotease [Candidatus Eremiobacteraeota bacterium]
MKVGKVLLGVAAGFAAGYVTVRTIEASLAWAQPPPKRERDAVAYGRLRRAFDVIETIRSIAGLAAFAYGRFGDRSDRAVRRLPAWLRAAPFFLSLSLVSAIADLPVAFVQDYELERRFGLSDQSRRRWLTDYFKSAAIGSAMTAFVATLFGAAIRRAPKTWPLWASVLTFPLFVAGNVIVPLYVMPLFNAFEPVTGSLEARLRRLAARFGVGDAEILRMDMSRQTRKANAFVTGIGRTHRIVLGDTLIDSFREDEIEFVVAHELGHYVSHDTWRLIGMGELFAAILFAIAAASTPG